MLGKNKVKISTFILFAIFAHSNALELGEKTTIKGIVSKEYAKTEASTGVKYNKILTITPDAEIAMTCTDKADSDEECPQFDGPANIMHLVFNNEKSAVAAERLRGKHVNISGHIIIPNGEGWASLFVFYADSIDELDNASLSKNIPKSISAKLSIGSYQIGNVRNSTEESSSYIYSVDVSDSGNSRDLLYVFDTLRAIKTTYPKIESENFETSNQFSSMLRNFTDRFGNPSKIHQDQFVKDSENQFGKSTRKYWQWNFPEGQIQLIAVTSFVDKEMLKYFSRAQAQQYKKTDYRFMNRSVKDIEEELYFGMVHAITSSTQVQLKIWGNLSGDRLAHAMIMCSENSDSCYLRTNFGPSSNEFSDIDAPSSWYQLPHSTPYSYKESKTVMGKTFEFTRKGTKKTSTDGYLIQSITTSADKNTLKPLFQLIRSAIPIVALGGYSHADNDVKAKIGQKMMINIIEPMINNMIAYPVMKISTVKIEQKQSY